ncbi:aminotransferase class III-fold pyridoxal phosphate-dependent enzyme [Moorena sp. SIO3H5]|uniref:aminotransferase class III-fold pyridoxal phosphate-dependent enzyme n=1 Tax=Moorena sp. SIO3H5 TaxID=2607834 RepID=UPI0013B8AD57|nr:aminotransferase class III-fold pyridoxal phosphate-dependent enzyme [Moorena sp. SIO3H5]NEO72980.1 aminotransferase class III-fold pyridoxal phosphate-dependent enzyme [Moorena sp. SIO3H5]
MIFKNEGSTIGATAVNIEKAFGPYLWDSEGRKYFDLFSQTWSLPLGHNNPRIIDAVKNQLDKVTHLRTAFSTQEKVELAQLLIELSPQSLTKVNFCLHGSLVNEGAMKLAINNCDDRHKILYLEDGFHGRSFATMGVSWKGTAEQYQPYFNHGVEVKKDLADIEVKMIKEQPAAIILELVQGNCGFKILSKSLVQGIRELCDQNNVVMIVDEIQTAFGCVKEMFMSELYDVEPDIITFGKSIGGGFPLAGLLYKEKFSFKPGQHSFTFAHSPISFTAGKVFLAELKKEAHKANILNRYIYEELVNLQKKYTILGEIRSIGTKAAVDIVAGDHEQNCKLANLIAEKMFDHGVIIAASRYKDMGDSIMLQAPLISEVEDLQMAFEKLDLVLEEVSQQKKKSQKAGKDWPEPIDQGRSILDHSENEIFQNDPIDIVEHSQRHAIIAEAIARKMDLPDGQIEILKRASWAHDIGGALKHKYQEEQKFLLRLEFVKTDKSKLGAKPSFNPKLCIEHAKKRIAAGLRKEITAEEFRDPLPLYLEEFELLKGEPLSSRERELLKTWWYHPQYSVDLLNKRNIIVTPEVEVLIRCNEQPWLFESHERVLHCINESSLAKSELKNLLAIMRIADIVENGNNKKRRNLRGVEVEDFPTTLAFIKHKFELDGLEDCSNAISALEELKKDANEQLIDTILKSRANYLVLKDGFDEATIEKTVRDSIKIIENRNHKVANYKYSPDHQLSVLHENLWYKFSFVPERKGEFDTLMLLEEALPEKVNELEIPHLSPKNRRCPFCYANIDELICKLQLPSNKIYSFFINIDPYGEDHLIMAGGKEEPQILTESYIDDLLTASYALGKNYEGSFTSFSGASVKHSHGQFYRVKTPVWQNLLENRIEIVNKSHINGVINGELANWAARTIIIKGQDRTEVAKQVWKATYKLMSEGISYNTKFMYCEDRNYIWLLAPRSHGFMTFAKYLLAPENEPEPLHVSGCGSIESPGGDAIMFFDIPEEIPQLQQKLMAQRFAKTLRETSNWCYKPFPETTSLLRRLNLKQFDGFKIAHRIESLETAQKAINEGFDMIEVDVQLTKDHELVSLWGPVKSLDQPVANVFEFNYEELCLRLGKNVLKIEDLCKQVNGQVAFNFDIKDWSDKITGYREALVNALVKLIKYHNLQNNVLFESFNLDYILALKTVSKEHGVEIMAGIAVPQDSHQNAVIETIRKCDHHSLSSIFIYPQLLSQNTVATLNETRLILITRQNKINNNTFQSIACPILSLS